MQFLREHLFYVILIGVTVLLGGAAMGYWLTRDVDEKLEARAELSRDLASFARRREKVNEESVRRLRERIERLRTGAREDANEATAFNQATLREFFPVGSASPPVLQLRQGAASTEAAFPIDERRYNDLGLYFVFIKEYLRRLNEMVDPCTSAMAVTAPPTREEIRAKELSLAETAKEQAYTQAVQLMTLEKARAGRIYADLKSLDPVFTNETRATPEQLWNAQVNLWVTWEVARAIATTNQQAAERRRRLGLAARPMTVPDAPVKRLVKLEIGEEFYGAGRGGGLGGRRDAGGTLTQRSTTADVGVIHYRFTVIADGRAVQDLLRTLMTQNYHTVLRVGLAATDDPLGAADNYYYGTEPVVLLDVQAEFLLRMEWVRPLMPPAVARRLPSPAPTR